MINISGGPAPRTSWYSSTGPTATVDIAAPPVRGDRDARRSEPGANVEGDCFRTAMRFAVLVVAVDPELEPIALVAALRRAVEDRVIAHQELNPAPGIRVGLVDDRRSRLNPAPLR